MADYTADIPIKLNLVAQAITSDKVTKEATAELERVSQAIAETVLNPKLKVEFTPEPGQKSKKKFVKELLGDLATQIEKSGASEDVKNAYKKFNDDVVASLSAISGKYEPKIIKAFGAVLSGKSLESYDSDTQKQVKKFEIAYKRRLKAIQQAVTSAESIFNFGGNGEDGLKRLVPFINEDLTRQLQLQLEKLKQFERATNSVYAQREARKDAELAFAKSRAKEWEKLRAKDKQAPETFDLRGTEEAYRKLKADARLKRMLTTDATEKLRFQDEIARFEKELSAIGNRRRELAGSTLGKSIDEASLASSRSSKAKRFYEQKFMEAPSGSLEKATYAARAKSEAQRAMKQAELVLSKTDPGADASARERVDMLTREKIALDALIVSEEKHFKAQVKGTESQKAAIAKQQDFIKESAKARVLIDDMAYLQKDSGDYLLSKQKLQTSLGNVRSLGKSLGGGSLEQSQRLLAEAEAVGIKLRQKAADQKKVAREIERESKAVEKVADTQARIKSAVPSYRQQVSGLAAGGLNSFYTLMQKDAQGAVGALSELKLLREDIMSSYRDAKTTGLRDERKELKALEMQLGKLIKSYEDFDKAANKPARELRQSGEKKTVVTAAAARRIERERVKAASLEEGRAIFESVGGIRNYARIGQDSYEPAYEYAKAAMERIKVQRANVRDDSSLSSQEKKRSIRELNLEYNNASKAASYLNAEIRGSIGFMRQLTLASKAFFRYFVLYGGAYQIIGYFKQMTSALVDFQDSLKETQVIAQASNAEMVSIGDTVRNVAAATGQSLQTVSNAAQTLAQAGVDVKNIPAALKAVSDFALATGSSLETASDVIASAKEIFQGDLTFGGAADQLTRAINISKLRAEDLKTIFNLGAQTAQVSGLTSAQFLGASATLSNLGIKSSTVATGLRQLLLELFNPDEKTMDFLRKRYNKLGEMKSDAEIRNLYQGFQRSNNPLMDALTELRRIGAAGVAQDDFRRVLDIRAENVALPLLKRLDDLSKNIARVSETGAAAQGATDRVDTLRKALEALAVKAQLLGENLLGGVAGDLQKFAEGIGSFIDRIIEYRDKLGREGASSQVDSTTGVAGAIVGGALARARGAGSILTGAASVAGGLIAPGAVKSTEALKDPETASLIDKAIKALALFTVVKGSLTWFSEKIIDLVAAGKQLLKVPTLVGGIAAGSGAGSLRILVSGLVSLVTKLNPYTALASLALLAYELYDTIGGAAEGTKNIDLDVIRKDIAKYQKELDAAKDELKNFDPTTKGSLTNQANEALRAVTEYQSTLEDLFGQNTEKAREALKMLGDTPIEAGSELAKKVRDTLAPLWSKPFNEKDFASLSKVQAEFSRAQGYLFASSERILKKAADLTADPQAVLTKAEQQFLASYNEIKASPLFKPDAFSPQNMVESLMDLFRLMDLEVKAAQSKINTAQYQLQGSQDILANDTVSKGSSDPRALQNQQIRRQQILQNPTEEGIDELKGLKKAYASRIDALQKRLTSGQPLSQGEFANIDKQLATAQQESNALAEELKTAQAGLIGKIQRETKAKEEQAAQQAKDEQNRRDAEEVARQAIKKEAELTLLRTETASKLKNLDDQILEAKAKKEWGRLLDSGGLLDQEYEVRKKLLAAEQGLVAMELQQAARSQGVDLPPDLKNIDLSQREQLITKPETKSLLEQFDRATEELNNANAEYLKDRAQIAKDSKQVAPFAQSAEYESRLNKIDALRSQLLDIREKGGEDALKIQKDIFDLEMQNLKEQLADVERQKAAYDAAGPGRYENARDKVTNKIRDLQTKFDRDFQQAADKRAITDLKSRIRQLEQEKKRLENLREQSSTGPYSTRQQTLTIMGRTPMATGSGAGSSVYDPLFNKYQSQYPQIPQGLLKAIASVESGFNPNAVSPKGAQGLMQLMPGTAKSLGVTDSFDPEQSVKAAAENLKWLLDHFNGSVEKAIQGYNTSYKNVDAGNIPAETRAYLTKVMAAMGNAPAPAPSQFPPNVSVGRYKGDVYGLDKLRSNAPEVVQAITGGAMKWGEQGGRVILTDVGRNGKNDLGNHGPGYAADVQLVDKSGRWIPKRYATGEDFRKYEQFWQDGMAYAMQQYPNMEEYFRAGAYFLNKVGNDPMHGDVTRKYKPGTSIPAGGSLREGANAAMKARYPGILSQGIPNGDWNAYRQSRFGEGLSGGGARTVDLPVFTKDNLDTISGTTAEIGRIDTEIAALSEEINRLTGGGVEGAAAIAEKYRTEAASNSAKEQQAKIDRLRGGIQNYRQQLEQSQAYGLPTGPADTAAREAAGLTASPRMNLEQLTRNEGFMAALVEASQVALIKAINERKGVLDSISNIDNRLATEQLSDEMRKTLEADKKQREENLKAYDAAIIEFNRDISETSRLLFANRQQQQMYNPSLRGNTYKVDQVDANGNVTTQEVKTYGQLDQVNVDNLLGKLNELSYSFNKLGENINKFIVDVIDTTVDHVARAILGLNKANDAAANAEYQQATANAQYDAAIRNEQIRTLQSNANPKAPGYSPEAIRNQRQNIDSAYQASQAANKAQLEAAAAAKQQQDAQSGLGGALTALTQEFSVMLMKTAIMTPIEGIINSITGKADGSEGNPFYVWVKNGAGSKTDTTNGDGASSGGVIDKAMSGDLTGALEGAFSNVKDSVSGFFDKISSFFSEGMKSGGWLDTLVSGAGSFFTGIVGGLFADGGYVRGPGSGTSDSIPAWLSNGEYVLTAAEVQRIGVRNLDNWKAAMMKPAKFASGGLVSTFDRARSGLSNSGSTQGDSGPVVNIYDQRSMKDSSPVEVTKSKQGDKEMINIMVKDAVKKAINDGALDRTMQSTYGIRRTGAMR